jgi:hypothetical protein
LRERNASSPVAVGHQRAAKRAMRLGGRDRRVDRDQRRLHLIEAQGQHK